MGGALRPRRGAPLTETGTDRRSADVYAFVVTEYQVTYWRDLPSLVVARDGDDVTKAPLAPRFQEAIDEAAMRLGESGSEDYLAGWTRGDWTPVDGSTAEVADRINKYLN